LSQLTKLTRGTPAQTSGLATPGPYQG